MDVVARGRDVGRAAVVATCLVSLLVTTPAVPVATAMATPVPAGPESRTAAPPVLGLNVVSQADLERAEARLGVTAGVVGIYADFAHHPRFPRAAARTAWRAGSLLLVSWEPWDWDRPPSAATRYEMSTIAAGRHDRYLRRWARDVRRFAHPTLIRFAPEMNGDWTPWRTTTPARAKAYRAAFRHVVTIFRRAGATNAYWVFNPVIDHEGATPLPEVWPGADVVDIVAADGHNWGRLRDWGWPSWPALFDDTMAELASLDPTAATMVAETGAAPDPRKAAWIARGLSAAEDSGLDAVVWFEVVKETDWRLTQDAETSAAAATASSGWVVGGDAQAVAARLLTGVRR